MRYINHKSDFQVVINITDKEGNIIAPPSVPWEAVFADENCVEFKCYYDGTSYTHCIVDGNNIVCFVDNPGFSCGNLRCTFYQHIPSAEYCDGVMDLTQPLQCDIMLSKRESDDSTPITIEASPNWVRGPQGEQGIQGPQGIKGDKGDKGEKGDKGDTGAKGDKGDKGEQGIQGEKGVKGDRGEKGDQGERGLQGVQGVKGNDGVSPTVTTSKIGKVTTIEITDANGVHTATVNDGESVEVVQSTGTSTTAVMSQKAVSDAIPRNKNNIPSKLFMCDENGNVVLDLSNGFVKTKNFDSTKITEEIESLLQIITENYKKIEEVENKIKISGKFGSTRLFVRDENGNVLLELYDGVIKTKSFNSNVLPTINTNNNKEFNIGDCFGNVLLSIKNGNIISKKFNSNDVNTLALRVAEIERKSDGYDSLIARSTPAISWIDDDFNTYSAERLNKLNILKSWAIENNIKPDIALIPDVTYTDAQRTDIESIYFDNERLSLAKEFEYSGIHMLTHPIHYGIYGDVIKDGHYIRKNLFLSRKALLDAGFPGCDIFVYAGSSAGVADVVEAAKAYYDVAIMPGGNKAKVNLPTKQDRFRLVRFSLDDISETNTVSQIKQQIDECIATGGWIIFITHVWAHTGDGTEPVDETSNSLSNVFNIIQYANQKVQIRPTQEVWKEKKILWEYYK